MFDVLTQFTVLIERRGRQTLGLLALLLAAMASLLSAPGAVAQQERRPHVDKRAHKLSPDLKAAIEAAQVPKVRWAREQSGRRQVQVVFVVADGDEQMSGLRA